MSITPTVILAWASHFKIPFRRAGLQPGIFDMAEVERDLKVLVGDRRWQNGPR